MPPPFTSHVATRGKALSLLQKTSKKRTPAQMEAQKQLDDTAATLANPIGASISQFMMQPPISLSQKEAQKRRKTMGPLQFSQS